MDITYTQTNTTTSITVPTITDAPLVQPKVAPVQTKYERLSDQVALRGDALILGAESAPIWRIQRITINYGATVTAVREFAGNSREFIHAWDQRDQYIYS